MVKALELSMQDSLQVWVIDQQSYSPYSEQCAGHVRPGLRH